MTHRLLDITCFKQNDGRTRGGALLASVDERTFAPFSPWKKTQNKHEEGEFDANHTY